MSSFPAAARRVRDSAADPVTRFWALRECSLRFPLYGFRATWHHVTERAGVPPRLSDDPDSLTRAIDELEEARRHWLLRSPTAAGTRRPRANGNRTSAIGG